MKIITLVENLVNVSGLVAEHGLAIWIDTGQEKILFDTGQSGVFIQNAEKLGIPIEEADALVISHGHSDHTGGLIPFLEINKKAKVYAKKEIFTPKYNGKTHFIGTEYNENILSGRLHYLEEITEIFKDVFVFPTIQINFETDTNFTRLYTKKGDSFFEDHFDDELFLAIRNNGSLNIITACSHRGITNICSTAKTFLDLPVNLILGGFHMRDCSAEQYEHIIEYFRTIGPKLIGACHCTGVERFSAMMAECDAKVFYNCTGNEITLK